MKFSTKSSYGILALMYIGKKQNSNEYISLGSISKYLDISKIYLEQIFTLFKKSKLVISTKGANGGYRISKDLSKVNLYDILFALESPEVKSNPSFNKNNNFHTVLENSVITPLEKLILKHLQSISLKKLIEDNIELDKINNIYYI